LKTQQEEIIFDTEKLKGEYPKFSSLELSKKTHDYALCIPVINEGQRVQRQITEMKKLTNVVDVIIADGGSTDGSLEESFIKENLVNTRLTKLGAGKLSAQMRMAIAFCMHRDYQGVIFVDGNGKDDISAVPNFIEKLKEGFDHIQGSRYLPGGHHENTPLLRHLGVTFLHAPLISLSAGYRYTDTTNGFRAYSAKFLQDEKVAVLRNVFSAYELHYYLAIRAARLGFKVTEIPVIRKYPKGKVPSKINSWKGYTTVLQTLFKAAFHRYDPKEKNGRE